MATPSEPRCEFCGKRAEHNGTRRADRLTCHACRKMITQYSAMDDDALKKQIDAAILKLRRAVYALKGELI